MRIEVLDLGYVEFIEALGRGRDQRHRPETRRQVSVTETTSEWTSEPDYEIGIIEAARQSTQGSFRGWEEDQKLLRTLFTSIPKHAGPFEFADLVIEVQAPIVVFREWHRHRTQSYNEMSARYAPLPEGNYVPSFELLKDRCYFAYTTRNKQLQSMGGPPPTDVEIRTWLNDLTKVYNYIENVYQQGLRIGIPKEVARLPMAVGHYSRMRAKANLRNWLSFMTLRDEEGVMGETREYSRALGEILQSTFPRTWALYREEKALWREFMEWRKKRDDGGSSKA